MQALICSAEADILEPLLHISWQKQEVIPIESDVPVEVVGDDSGR